jgi:hypothetical protein
VWYLAKVKGEEKEEGINDACAMWRPKHSAVHRPDRAEFTDQDGASVVISPERSAYAKGHAESTKPRSKPPPFLERLSFFRK